MKDPIYTDTSVVSRLFDDVKPLGPLTRQFWKELHRFRPCISDLVVAELTATPDEHLRRKPLAAVDAIPRLHRTPAVDHLAAAYLRGRATPHYGDAVHLAFASLEGVRYLVSWNMKHLVRRLTQNRVAAINRSRRLPVIELVTPAWLTGESREGS